MNLNGQELGILWKAPYRIELGGAAQAGENLLEIQVAISWVNRLIGDAQPGVREKVTFTPMLFSAARNSCCLQACWVRYGC